MTFKAAKAPARATKATFILSIASLLLLIFPRKSAIFSVTSENLPANLAMLFATLSILVEFFAVSVFIPKNEFMTFPIKVQVFVWIICIHHHQFYKSQKRT